MSSSSSPKKVAKRLAEALVAGPWRLDDLIERGSLALGRKRRWLAPVVKRLLAAIGTKVRPTSAKVGVLVLNDSGFVRASARDAIAIPSSANGIAANSAEMWPGRGVPASWGVPPLLTPAELAGWLRLCLPHLEWLADPHARERRLPQRPGRYTYRWTAKRSGTARLVEVPASRLRDRPGGRIRGPHAQDPRDAARRASARCGRGCERAAECPS